MGRLQIGKNDKLKQSYNYFTGDYDSIIIPSSQTKDLGIIMSEDGTFKDHINTIHSKVTKRINWILRSFTNRSQQFMRFVWRTYILPIIDYSSQLWAPQEGVLLTKFHRSKVAQEQLPQLAE